MRIGICLNMLATQPGDTGIDWIEAAVKAGFDYVELPLAEMSALTEDAFAALGKRVERSGIRCETCNNLFPKDLRLTGPQADVSAIKGYARHAMERASRLGVAFVVFGSGPAKTVPEGFPLDAGYRQVVEVARIAADMAAEHGIGIVIEPLRAAECNVINTFEEGCQLARDADRPNVFGLVDYYHLSQMEEPVAHIVQQGQLLRHVHFARNDGRVFPQRMEEEAERYVPFADALRAIGYDGRVSLEAYAKDFAAEAPAALDLMRELFNGRK